ncbi:diguanylate cyclase [Clostridiales bacterium COT073_COT-073]|nr:diguanylate cyclase [Clostridiales bacterium COT073_COT-073]
MDKEKYLPMTSEELYENFIPDVYADIPGSRKLIRELESTTRYLSDYEFRAFIDTAKAILLSSDRNNTQLIPLCTTIIEDTSALSLWKLVSINYYLIGNAYYDIAAFERALSSYQTLLKIESQHNFLAMTSASYHHIALIYLKLDAYDKAQEYFEHALASLERSGPDHPHYTVKLISSLSNLVSSLCRVNHPEKIPALLERMKKLILNSPHSPMIYCYHTANMHYAFYTGDYQAARSAYKKAKETLPKENDILSSNLLFCFISLCDSFKLSYDFYIEELLSVLSARESEHTSTNIQVYNCLRKYYQQTENTRQYKEATQKYIQILEQNVNDTQAKQLSSLDLVNDLRQHHEDLAEITSKNTELKVIAEEANHHKNALQEAYHSIEMINELGQKMTSSLKLSEVIDLIYQNLKENVPLTNFILMVADLEQQQLRTIAHYENNRLQPELCFSFDNPNSILIECYKQNKLIFTDDIQTDERFKMRNLIQTSKTLIRSAIYMPLNVGNQLIGVCSIQDKMPHIYTTKHISFLKQLLPYLSISLNNAVRSRKLEREIRLHLKTQFELEKANHRLELLSALDGLTQISSRRDFDMRIIDLLCQAKAQQKTISVFMFDIDNFKLYNDTYGHLEGDKILKKVAQTIRHHLDKVNGLSARFGGEEFIGACMGLPTTQSRQLANQIRQEIYHMEIENLASPLGRVTISGGVAIARKPDTIQKSEIMRLADISLYQAKNTGKNKIVLKKMEDK